MLIAEYKNSQNSETFKDYKFGNEGAVGFAVVEKFHLFAAVWRELHGLYCGRGLELQQRDYPQTSLQIWPEFFLAFVYRQGCVQVQAQFIEREVAGENFYYVFVDERDIVEDIENGGRIDGGAFVLDHLLGAAKNGA